MWHDDSNNRLFISMGAQFPRRSAFSKKTRSEELPLHNQNRYDGRLKPITASLIFGLLTSSETTGHRKSHNLLKESRKKETGRSSSH